MNNDGVISKIEFKKAVRISLALKATNDQIDTLCVSLEFSSPRTLVDSAFAFSASWTLPQPQLLSRSAAQLPAICDYAGLTLSTRTRVGLCNWASCGRCCGLSLITARASRRKSLA